MTATGSTDGRRKARRHALYIGKTAEHAPTEELRAFCAARQARKASRSTGRAGAGSSTGSGGTSSDSFNKRRPLSDDFATIGSQIGPTFEEARRANYEAIQREHRDKGRSVEQAKCINAAWARIKRHYGK